MGKKYIDQGLFDVSVTQAINLNRKTGHDISFVVAEAKKNYEWVIDDGVWLEIEDTANEIAKFYEDRFDYLMKTSKEFRDENSEPGHDGRPAKEWMLDIFWHDISKIFMETQPNGKKKSFFNGHWFMKSEKILNKKQECIKRIKSYYFWESSDE